MLSPTLRLTVTAPSCKSLARCAGIKAIKGTDYLITSIFCSATFLFILGPRLPGIITRPRVVSRCVRNSGEPSGRPVCVRRRTISVVTAS